MLSIRIGAWPITFGTPCERVDPLKRYTNVTEEETIRIDTLRDIVGRPFRLKPGDSIDLDTSLWSPAIVRANQKFLTRHVKGRRLSVSNRRLSSRVKTGE